MQLGCTLSRKHRRWMKANWNGCLFMYERLDQAKMAAFEYENGTPLRLDSKRLHEKMMTLSQGERKSTIAPALKSRPEHILPRFDWGCARKHLNILA